jgi:riboflavin kinase, archaea type
MSGNAYVTLRGRVCAGLGKCSREMPGHLDHYERKTGIYPVPGTLNLRLDEPFYLPEDVMCLEAAEYGGDKSVYIVPCEVNGRRALILRTDRNERGIGPHPKTIIEVAADFRLRDWLGVSDGDIVEVRVPHARQ